MKENLTILQFFSVLKIWLHFMELYEGMKSCPFLSKLELDMEVEKS